MSGQDNDARWSGTHSNWHITLRGAPRGKVRSYLSTPTAAHKQLRLDGATAVQVASYGSILQRLVFSAAFGRWMDAAQDAIVRRLVPTGTVGVKSGWGWPDRA